MTPRHPIAQPPRQQNRKTQSRQTRKQGPAQRQLRKATRTRTRKQRPASNAAHLESTRVQHRVEVQVGVLGRGEEHEPLPAPDLNEEVVKAVIVGVGHRPGRANPELRLPVVQAGEGGGGGGGERNDPRRFGWRRSRAGCQQPRTAYLDEATSHGVVGWPNSQKLVGLQLWWTLGSQLPTYGPC